jgi:glycosyltransferase involved in cell wall biosynthesis
MQPEISLVMTVYNRERFLSEAIESVLTQTLSDFELVIWDDGSTDSSLEIARSYAEKDNRIRLIEAEHKGRVSSLVSAIAESSAPFLGWVDSDDLLSPTVLEETSAVLAAHPEVGLVYTDYIVIDQDGKARGYGRRCRIPYSKERLLLDLMTFHFRLMRRSVFDQAGGINPSFEMAMDYDLCLRLSEATEARHIRKPLYRYRNHRESLSSSRRVEQMHYAKRAISEALERRGLADQFEVDLQIRGRFSLKRRHPDG